MVQLLSITSNPLLSMLFVFTFHYGSITINGTFAIDELMKSFTFHYGSITIVCVVIFKPIIGALHSIMVQLLSI